MRIRGSIVEFIAFFVMAMACITDIYFCSGDANSAILKVIELELFLIYVYVFSFVWMKFGLYDLRTLFVFALGIFSLGNVFLTLFGIGDFLTVQFSISDFVWEEITAVNVLTYYVIFLTAFYGVCLLSRGDTRQRKSQNSLRPNFGLLKLAKKVFLSSFPFALAYRLFFAIVVMRSGYASIYNHTVEARGPLFMFLKLFLYLFTISYFIICAEENDAKQFTKYSLFYLCCAAIQIVQGSRAQSVCALIFVLFYRKIVFGVEFKALKVTLGVLVLIPILYTVGLSRQGLDVSDADIFNMYADLPLGLSGSINVAGYYFQNKDLLNYNTYPYVLDPIIRLYLVLRYPSILNGGQSQEMIGVRYNLGHQMTYNISESYYLAGHGVDSNFIAEFSEFGFWGVIIGSVIISYIISKYSVNIIRSKYLKFMAPIFVQYVLFIPRASAFLDTYTIAKWTFVYCIVVLVGRKLRY